ncbi:formate dehydrogenase subunit gamma [Motiliproteus sediminis]|uniref:formate dehydrogenase subunit gamma n=1 Tax=Motiliproteus sediminis TaxID=1468178 RepID=UPI001AEFB489|nr:formate dehydrogenase subunit gamma [Motiliproteus sediminis]
MVYLLKRAWSESPLNAVLVPMLLLVLLVTLAPLVQAADPVADPAVKGNGYQGAEYWRDVTRGVAGYSATPGNEAGVLINRSGDEWRLVRNQQVKPYGAWLLGGTLLVLVLVFMLLGRNKIKEGRSGRTLKRWDLVDRVLHWSVAGLFVLLALTGLSILYGRHFLLDALGGGFGGFMQFSKLVHNYLGPLFVICLALMLLKWLGRNIFNAVDLRWFARLGGLFGGHPSAGYMNGGEKMWYWVLFFGGVAICATGLVMDFPNFGQLRDTMQDANLIHAGVSLVLICGALAHAYMGSLGTEGVFEGMVSGEVDENWAKQHHNLWYDEAKGHKPPQ